MDLQAERKHTHTQMPTCIGSTDMNMLVSINGIKIVSLC